MLFDKYIFWVFFSFVWLCSLHKYHNESLQWQSSLYISLLSLGISCWLKLKGWPNARHLQYCRTNAPQSLSLFCLPTFILKKPFHPVRKSLLPFITASACRYLKICFGQRRLRVRWESKYVMDLSLISTETSDQCTSKWMGINNRSFWKMSTFLVHRFTPS